MPGLYKVVAQAKNGVIVESLVDKKRVPAFNCTKSVRSQISVFIRAARFTSEDVFQKIFDKEAGAKCLTQKRTMKKVFVTTC